jgi:hypothetical protein
MKRAMILGVCLGLLMLLFPMPVLARGVALGPPTLEIKNALRGGQYKTAVTIFNPSADGDTYKLGAEGEAGSWLTFYDWDTKQPIEGSLPLTGHSNKTLLIKVAVPSDAANGSYSATIYAETSPMGNIGGIGVSAVLRSTATLAIGVTGNEILDGSVGIISIRPTEVGMPLRIEVGFANKGNVTARPKIDCQISQDDIKVADFSYSETSISPGSQGSIPVEWATTASQAGDYTAHLTVSLGDRVLTTQDLSFKILPAGSLTIDGDFQQLVLQGKPAPGEAVTIQAVFANNGLMDIRAKLVGEVYQDGDLIGTFEGGQLVIHAGTQNTLTASFTPGQSGNYVVKGQVIYEGKKTDVKSVSLTIGGSAVQAGNQPSSLLLLLIVIIGGIIVIMLAVIIVRWRKSKSVEPRGLSQPVR